MTGRPGTLNTMHHILATGGLIPVNPHARFDVGPLLVLLGTLAAIRFLFRITMTWPVIGVGILAGVALGWAVTIWGVVTPTFVALLVAAMVAGPVRRWQASGQA
jgi:hypothetical protein